MFRSTGRRRLDEEDIKMETDDAIISMCVCPVCLHTHIYTVHVTRDTLIPLFNSRSDTDTFWWKIGRYLADTDTLP